MNRRHFRARTSAIASNTLVELPCDLQLWGKRGSVSCHESFQRTGRSGRAGRRTEILVEHNGS